MPDMEEKLVCSHHSQVIHEQFIHAKIHPCNTAKDRKTDNKVSSSVTARYKTWYTMKNVNFFLAMPIYLILRGIKNYFGSESFENQSTQL